MRCLQVQNPKGVVLICPATGVPSGFYQSFGEAVHAMGFTIVLFDYHVTQPGRRIDLAYWIQEQIPQMIAQAHAKANGAPVFVVGHSIGGIALGLGPHWDLLSGIIRVAPSTGCVWWTQRPVLTAFRLLVLMPVLCLFFRVLPSRLSGLGAQFPRAAMLQWARWCGWPGYGFRFLRRGKGPLEVPYPVLDIQADDDEYITARNYADLDRFYAYSNRECVTLSANKHGPIGHVGFFRKSHAEAWRMTFEWLEQLAAQHRRS